MSKLIKHGHFQGGKKSRTYATYGQMIQRCHNPNSSDYHRYGAKGITVCPRWRESFENFLEDMGERPEGMTLDREKVGLGYSKDNCRWATYKTQARDKRRMFEHDGMSMCVEDWAKHTGIKLNTLKHRIYNLKWDLGDALTP